MGKKFDNIYYKIIKEGVLGNVVGGLGKSIASNAGNIISNINPNASALPTVAKAVGQIPAALKNLAPKMGKQIDIEYHKKNPNSFLNTKIFKYINSNTKEIVVAKVSDVSRLKTNGSFTATLLDPNYIIIVSKKNNNFDPSVTNSSKEYVVKSNYFNDIKNDFNNHMKNFASKNNINININSIKNTKNLISMLDKKEEDLKNIILLIQKNTKKTNLKDDNYDKKSNLESEINSIRKQIENNKKIESEIETYMSKNLNYLQKKDNTFTVTSDEVKNWYYG
jgi:hypothetical protein